MGMEKGLNETEEEWDVRKELERSRRIAARYVFIYAYVCIYLLKYASTHAFIYM
jgi:hypothetical protein